MDGDLSPNRPPVKPRRSKKEKKKKQRRRREQERDREAGGSGGDEVEFSEEDDAESDFKARKSKLSSSGATSTTSTRIRFFVLASAVLLLLMILSRRLSSSDGSSSSSSMSSAASPSSQQGVVSAATDDVAEKSGRKRRKAKKGNGEEDDNDDNGEESLSMEGVDVIEAKHGNLGWNKLQGPLVRKRPPRECLIRRIAPQVTNPFYVMSKKTKWKRRLYTCLRAGKEACPTRIMDDFEARRWKLKENKRSLEDRVLSTFILTDRVTLSKLRESKPDVFRQIYVQNEGSSYLNALVGASGLDGTLREQFSVRAAFTKSYGCSYNALKVQPPQFRFDVFSECEKLDKSFAKHPADSWIVARSDSNGKEELTVTTTAQMNAEENKFCSKNAGKSSTRDSEVLASLAVANPFKLEGKLFDIRSFMLIGSTLPFMVFFRQGYVRQASAAAIRSPFQFDEGSGDISLEAFQEHLAKEKITGSHYVDTFLQSSMKQVALFLFHAARTKIERRKGSYQLFSVDFIVDSTFRVYLEKTSGMPDLESNHRMDMPGMIADIHDLVQELQEVPVAFEGMVKGDKYGKWELIFSELRETCHKIVYNPCHIFIDYNDKDLTKQNRKVGRVQQTAKRLENERKRIVKKTEEKKKEQCRERHIPYPGSKCDKWYQEQEQERINTLFKEHEQSFNPNEFRLAKPGEVFPHEIVE